MDTGKPIIPPEKPIFAPGHDERDKEVYDLFYGTIPARVIFRWCDMLSLMIGVKPQKVRIALVKLCDELQEELRKQS